MPRNTFDITSFTGGSVPSADRSNVAPPAVSYVLNGDPEYQIGAIAQRRHEILAMLGSPISTFGPSKNGCVLTRNDGKYDLVFHHYDAVKTSPVYEIRALEDWGNNPLSPATNPLLTLTSADTECTFEPINEEVRMGYGNTSSTSSRWFGYIRNGQFDASAPAAMQSTTAACLAPQTIPPMYKTFCVQISSVWYTYGIVWEGRRVYRINMSTGAVSFSQELFSKTQGLCNIDGTSCYVFDYDGSNGLGTLYKVKMSDFAISEKYTMTDVLYTNASMTGSDLGATRGTAGIYYSSTDLGGVVSDLECTTNYLCMSCYRDTGGWGLQSATMLTVAKSSLVNNQSFTPKNVSFMYGALGASVGAIYGEDNPENSAILMRHALFQSSTATEVGIVIREWPEIWINDGLSATSNIVLTGQDYNFVVVVNETILGAAYPAITTLNGTNSKGCRVQINTGGLATVRVRGIANGPTGEGMASFDDYLACSSTEASSTYFSLTGMAWLDPWSDTTVPLVDLSYQGGSRQTGSVDFMNDVCVAYYMTPDDSHYYFAMVVAQDQSNGAIFSTRGRIAVASYDNDGFGFAASTYLKTSEMNIYCTSLVEPPGDGPFTNARKAYYKASYIYDGYQESPMMSEPVIFNTTAGQSVQLRMLCYKNMSARVTGINIYRAESDQAASAPQGYYRQVVSIDLTSILGWAKTIYEAAAWGNYYEYTYTDIGSYGVSYEANTEISEDITDTNVNYKLQCLYAGYHFVANCYSSYYDDATHILFRSKLNAPDMFDISTDYLKLPVIPTAMAAYGGYVWVFDKSHIYRINPQNMVIEDVTSGAGCIGYRAVTVTEEGMFFADERTIWMYNGQNLADIGFPIQTAYDSSWMSHQARIAAGNQVQILAWPQKHMVVVFYWGTNLLYYGYSTRMKSWWAYKTESGIWDGEGSNMLAQYTIGAFLDGHRGEIMSATGTTTDGGLIRFWQSLGDSGNQDAFAALEVYTGGFTAGDASQSKKLYILSADSTTTPTLTRAIDGSTTYSSMTLGEFFKEVSVKAVIAAGGSVNVLRGLSITFRQMIGKR